MNDGRKRKAPKHQNKTAFKIQFDPLSLEIHKRVSFKGLCKRCADQINWKIKYNKYKKMAQPGKCTFCHQKNVSRTYMRACQACTEQKNICPKCLQTQTEEQIEVRLNQIQQKKQDEQVERKMNEFLKTLKERSRRTVKRLFEKEAITWDNQLQNFVDVEGKILPVQFRHGYGPNKSQGEDGSDNQQIDQSGSDLEQDDLQDQEEQKQANDSKKIKTKQIAQLKKPKQDEKQSNEKQNQKSEKQKEPSQSDEDCQDDLDELDDEIDQDENQAQDKKQQETNVKQSEEEQWQDVQSQNAEQVEQKCNKKSKKQKHKK